MADIDGDRAAEIEVHAVAGGTPPRDHVPDVIEVGSGRSALQRQRLGVAGLVCVTLVVGLVLGYLRGTQRAQQKTSATLPTGVSATPRLLVPAATQPPTPPTGVSATPRLLVSAGTQPPTPTGKRCSAQLGNQLQLGVEVVNQSSVDTTLMQAGVNLPMGGLRVAAVAWG